MAAHVLVGALLGLLVGALIAAFAGGDGTAFLYCALMGGLGGWVSYLSVRVDRLESSRQADESADLAPYPEAPQFKPSAPTPAPVPRKPVPRQPAPAPTYSAPEPAAQPVLTSPRDAPGPEFSLADDRIKAAVKEWFTSGNVPVKVGVVVVLFGVGFFVKYGIDEELFTLPIWTRLSAVALFGAALLGVGWRLRQRREVFALSLQGGGFGVLYLTTYAAFELYGLLPGTAALAIMVVVTVATGVAAVAQDSRALAVLGVAGGFLAPLLAAEDAGNHMALFSYYAVLNAAILTVAWFKAWRVLNLLGFAFTFAVASLWGYQAYEPEHFATTEPFLVLFVLMYVAIAVLFALRRPPNLRGFVDSTVVFGTPLIGFALQTQIVESEAGLAWTAAGLTAIYAALAALLWRVKDLRALSQCFIGLALLFLAVAVPQALDARWTCIAWAVQGATLTLFGMRNGARLLMFAGVALQVVAAAAQFEAGVFDYAGMPFLNGSFLASATLAASAWMIAWSFELAPLPPPARRALARLLLCWGGAWWFGAGFFQIDRAMSDPNRDLDAMLSAALLAFFAGSSLLAMLAARALHWQRLNGLALVLVPCMALTLAYRLVLQPHPLADFGALAWPLALGVQYAFLRWRESGYPRLAAPAHVATYWIAALLLAAEARWLAETVAAGVWPLAAAVTAASIFAAATILARPRLPWPLQRHSAYFTAGVPAVVATAALVVLAANLTLPGDATPLPYLPLVNPLMLASVAAGGAFWLCLDPQWRRQPAPGFGATAAFVALLLLSAEVARGVHHLGGVPFSFDDLAGSAVFQAGLSLVWGAAGLAAMVLGAVRERRPVWIGGAVVMGLVIVKLFLVELGNAGTISRVVSFLSVGVLLLVVGYLAPVPKGRRPGDDLASAESRA